MIRNNINLNAILLRMPDAIVDVKGSEKYSRINGRVRFYETAKGVLIASEINNLPTALQNCESPVFGFHIHSGESCTGDEEDSFKDALTHFNPFDCLHPHHSGDMPPLFGNHGMAFSVFLTDRFKLRDVIGKVVIIHSMPDDFVTQPSGNSGEKIACGKIIKNKR